MKSKKTMKDMQLEGQRVFCRVDFNVPMENGQVTDVTRIRAAIPTIEYMVEQGAKVILRQSPGSSKRRSERRNAPDCSRRKTSRANW